METSQSARRRGKKSGYELSQKDDWVDAPKSKSKSKEIKQKGIMEKGSRVQDDNWVEAPKSKEIKQKRIMEKGPRIQDDVMSVAENLIEEIIHQDKCHKSKYVDNNPPTSTSQIEQIQKSDLNQQNRENRLVCPKRKLLYGHVIYYIMPT